MVRSVYIQRSGSERMTLEMALRRCLSEISPTKKPTTQRAEATKAQQLINHLGKYSMAALSAEIIAGYCDTSLASITNRGKPTGNNTVRLELALLSHLFIVAIQEWGLGLSFGDSTFKTEVPTNVPQGIGFIRYIKSFQQQVFSESEVDAMLKALQNSRRAPTLATHREHVRNLKRRSDTTAERQCPKCGSALLIRTVKSGPKSGQQFWGCSTYPRYRTIQSITAEVSASRHPPVQFKKPRL